MICIQNRLMYQFPEDQSTDRGEVVVLSHTEWNISLDLCVSNQLLTTTTTTMSQECCSHTCPRTDCCGRDSSYSRLPQAQRPRILIHHHHGPARRNQPSIRVCALVLHNLLHKIIHVQAQGLLYAGDCAMKR